MTTKQKDIIVEFISNYLEGKTEVVNINIESKDTELFVTLELLSGNHAFGIGKTLKENDPDLITILDRIISEI